MSEDLIIKKSSISGKGVFANRNFNKGERVIKWPLEKILTKKDVNILPESEKKFLVRDGKKYILMQLPARYVNHSCNANTKPKNNHDIAIRDIKKGDEITSDYSKEDGLDKFKCNCNSYNCRKIIK